MAHDYTDPKTNALVSVADNGLMYSGKRFTGCRKHPVHYRMLDLRTCEVTNEQIFVSGAMSKVWELFEEWNDFGGIMYAPLARPTAEREEADKISQVFDKAVGR